MKFLFKSKIKYLKFFLFLIVISVVKNTYSNEIKPLEEIFNENDSSINSLITMQRCAAIYGAL